MSEAAASFTSALAGGSGIEESARLNPLPFALSLSKDASGAQTLNDPTHHPQKERGKLSAR